MNPTKKTLVLALTLLVLVLVGAFTTAAWAQYTQRCAATDVNGRQCANPARQGHAYCHVHAYLGRGEK